MTDSKLFELFAALVTRKRDGATCLDRWKFWHRLLGNIYKASRLD